MIKGTFRFILFFAISFGILNIPIGKKRVFDHLNYVAIPYSKVLAASSKKAAAKGWREGKVLMRKLFFNSVPPTKQLDEINDKLSAPQRKLEREEEFNLPEDSYTVEERALIEGLTKQDI